MDTAKLYASSSLHQPRPWVGACSLSLHFLTFYHLLHPHLARHLSLPLTSITSTPNLVRTGAFDVTTIVSLAVTTAITLIFLFLFQQAGVWVVVIVSSCRKS